jgi:bifunctional DNase/RNase
MIEVVIDSIRISLISQHRVVMLRDIDSERQLAIWIGPCEAEAITIELQDTEMARPLTHDLLENVVATMGGKVSHVLVSDLKTDVYYATLFVDQGGKLLEIDCRPSDAIALAVRVKCPIFVNEDVMEEAGVYPEPDISEEDQVDGPLAEEEEEDLSGLDAFKDFVDTLNFDDDEEKKK